MKDSSVNPPRKNNTFSRSPTSRTKSPAHKSKESPGYSKIRSSPFKASDLESNVREEHYFIVDTIEYRQSNDSKRSILYQMSASLQSHSITAIIGPKESGKSMLLNFLMGTLPRKKNISARGEIHLPGTKAFLPKDDHMHGYFTCYSYMWHYLYLSRRMRAQEVKTTPLEDENEIMTLLHSLSLDEDKIIGDYVISGLNAGEKRRLHLALIALSKPQTIFLEEPFLNVDLETSLIIMKFLKDFVQQGNKVIMTVSHPNSCIWQMIDRVILLSSGQLVYQGQRKKMNYFFEANGCRIPPGYNPPDHYVTVVNEDSQLSTRMVKEWVSAFENWKSSGESRTRRRMSDTTNVRRTIETRRTLLLRTLSSRRGISELSNKLLCPFKCNLQNIKAQFHIVVELTLRYVSSLSFHPMLLLWRGQMIIISNFLIGILFWNMPGDEEYFRDKDITLFTQSRIFLVQLIMIMLVFCTIVTIYPFIFQERYIVSKDIQNGYYSPTHYQIAWGISSFASSVVISIITTSILVLMLGSNTFDDVVTFYLCVLLFAFCTEALIQVVCVFMSALVTRSFSLGLAFLTWVRGFVKYV